MTLQAEPVPAPILPAPLPDVLDARLVMLLTDVSPNGSNGNYADEPSKAYWRIHRTVERLANRMVGGAFGEQEVAAVDQVIDTVINTMKAELYRFATFVEADRIVRRKEGADYIAPYLIENQPGYVAPETSATGAR